MKALWMISPTVLALFACSSLWLTGSLLWFYSNVNNSSVFDSKEQNIQSKSYSYIWDDYPLEAPIVLSPPTEVTFEETVHYPVIGPEARDEWLYDSPHGEGTFRLGPNHQYSTLSMFHQLHCLRTFRAAIALGDSYPMDQQKKHLNHCLNYLRENVLCAADTTLEPGDFTQRDFSLHRLGQTHMCHDPQELITAAENDWVDWYIYMKTHNISFEALREKDRKERTRPVIV